MKFTPTQRLFLDAVWVCVLSTLGPSGAPHSAPMWYVRDGDELLIITGVRSQKHRNMDRDDRVGVVIDRRERPYRAVMIQGRATPDATTAAALRARLAKRYISPDDAAAYLESRREVPGAVFRIAPDSIQEYGTP